ncbi:MAG: hypothetical protein V2I33_21110 [Kangiellaceae bacterium]|jgi:hypothetical protein|nr:hypothetical protein [Kangiellaceae bacterium]
MGAIYGCAGGIGAAVVGLDSSKMFNYGFVGLVSVAVASGKKSPPALTDYAGAAAGATTGAMLENKSICGYCGYIGTANRSISAYGG